MECAAQHVPGLELRLPVTFDGLAVRGAVRVCRDMDQRLGLDETGAPVHRQHGFGPCYGGAHQLALQFVAPTLAGREHVALVPADPGPERHLVHRAPDAGAAAFLPDHACRRPGKGREAVQEGGGPDIEVIGQAIMAQVPHDLHAGLSPPPAASAGSWTSPYRPGERSIRCHRNASRAGVQPGAPHQAVVLRRHRVVPGRPDQVELAAIPPPEGRPLEPALQEALEQALPAHVRHVRHPIRRQPPGPRRPPATPGPWPPGAGRWPGPARPPGPCCSTCRWPAAQRS